MTPIFAKGRQYKVRTATVAVRRIGTKLNLEGVLDDVEWNGSELAIFLTDDLGREHVFMEARLRNPDVTVSIATPQLRTKNSKLKTASEPCPIDFTLQELVEHFIIPDVPDVARVNPEGYDRNLQLLKQIENLCP